MKKMYMGMIHEKSRARLFFIKLAALLIELRQKGNALLQRRQA